MRFLHCYLRAVACVNECALVLMQCDRLCNILQCSLVKNTDNWFENNVMIFLLNSIYHYKTVSWLQSS